MRNLNLAFLFLIYSCSSGNTKRMDKTFLAEKLLPAKILDRYEHIINPPTLSLGTNVLEVRKWRAFRNDSFPLVLERYFVKNNQLNGECYFFSTTNGMLIETLDQLDSLAFQQLKLGDLPARYIDSLKRLSIFDIPDFDTKLFQKKNRLGMLSSMPSMLFIEEATAEKYKGVFITSPLSFTDMHPSLDRYAKFCAFTSDSLMFYGAKFEPWLNNLMAKAKNSGQYEVD